MGAIVAAHDRDVQMIDTPIVRVHQEGAMAKKGGSAPLARRWEGSGSLLALFSCFLLGNAPSHDSA